MYAIPEGTRCFVCAAGRKTIIRNKCGYLIESMNTLLPAGNSLSSEKGKTMLQGIYSRRDKVIYLTDILMWNDELLIDSTAEQRLEVLISKLRENPALSTVFTPTNEVLLRFPRMLDCSKSSLDLMYYGTYTRATDPGFETGYQLLLDYIKLRGLDSGLSLGSLSDLRSPETAQKICCAFGYDNTDSPYLKDGIAFVHKEGIFFLGFSSAMLQWKDQFVSPYYGVLLQEPMVAYLYLNKERKLQTHDGFIIDKTDPNIEKAKADQTYMFTYTNIYMDDPRATMEGLKLIKQCEKPVWSAMSHLVFKILARKNMLPYAVLAQQVQTEEIARSIPPSAAGLD